MISDVVWCLNTYNHGTDSKFPNLKYAQCPVCHKIVKIKKDGALFPHGVTRRKLDAKAGDDHGLG